MQRNQMTLEVVYDDEHLIELKCRVMVEEWAAIGNAYTTWDDLRKFADDLTRFGETLQATDAWEAGYDNGIGFIGLRFYTIDRSGHMRCHIRLASASVPTDRPEGIWRFAVELPVETWQVITFARQCVQLAENHTGQATLSGTQGN